MNEDWAQAIRRLTIALAGVAYVAVFLTALSGGAAVELALIKAAAAMVCLGVIGRILLALVDVPEKAGKPEPRAEAPRRLDVAVSAAPDETVGESK